MHRRASLLFITTISILSTVACTHIRNPEEAVEAQVRLLREAGQRMGVPVRAERAVTVAQGGATFLTAPAANLEGIPATELPRGVNVGVAYVDSAQASYTPGFYTLRAFAEPRQPGTVEGRLDLLDVNQNVVTTLPARFEITSMTLPDNPDRLITNVTFSASRLAATCDARYETCYCCTNGWIVCTSRLYEPVINVRAVD